MFWDTITASDHILGHHLGILFADAITASDHILGHHLGILFADTITASDHILGHHLSIPFSTHHQLILPGHPHGKAPGPSACFAWKRLGALGRTLWQKSPKEVFLHSCAH
jgi:hypothetical protein